MCDSTYQWTGKRGDSTHEDTKEQYQQSPAPLETWYHNNWPQCTSGSMKMNLLWACYSNELHYKEINSKDKDSMHKTTGNCKRSQTSVYIVPEWIYKFKWQYNEVEQICRICSLRELWKHDWPTCAWNVTGFQQTGSPPCSSHTVAKYTLPAPAPDMSCKHCWLGIAITWCAIPMYCGKPCNSP